jgi:hypothetical protein
MASARRWSEMTERKRSFGTDSARFSQPTDSGYPSLDRVEDSLEARAHLGSELAEVVPSCYT